MSQLIITTDVASIRPVFSEGTSENIKRYNQLKKLFENTKEYRILAEPIPAGGQKIAWHTEYEGKIIPFRKLDEEEQVIAKGLLKNEVNKIYKTIISLIDETSNIERLYDLIDSCIEIPDFDDLYIVQNANGQKNFCIVRWGFINDDFNAPKHLIANLIPLKVASVSVRAIKGNNKIAIEEKIFFEFNNTTRELVTDIKGRIFIEDVKLLTNVTAYQLDDNKQKIFVQTYQIQKDDDLTFYIGNQTIPKQNVSIQTLDSDDNIVQNVAIKIQYDDVDYVQDTNNQGIINLGELFIESKVTCSQLKNTEILKTITFDIQQGKSIYFFNIQFHKAKGNVKIRVIDENNEIIPFAQIQVKFPDQSIRYFESDEKGFVELDEVPFKEDLVIRQIVDKLPQYQQIIRFSEDNSVTDFKGMRIKAPDDFTKLIVKVVDKNYDPIPNLKVVVENGISNINQITNNEGLVFIDKIDSTKKIFAVVENKNHKKREEIKSQGKQTEHTIRLGKKVGLWWLWILLLLLLIALGVIFLPKIINGLTPIVVADTTTTIITKDSVVVKEHKGMKVTVVDQNNNPVTKANVKIILGDSTYLKLTNDKGEVVFSNLTDTTKTVIAITNAINFTEQRFTFRVTKNKIIKLNTESVEISEIILPCGTQVESKGYRSTIQTFNLKKSKGTLSILYDMFSIPDKIIVYKGKSTEISDANILWQSPKYEDKQHKVNFKFDTPDSLITVQIKGGDTTRTEWYFKVYCP